MTIAEGSTGRIDGLTAHLNGLLGGIGSHRR